jgi:hypothetical protein
MFVGFVDSRTAKMASFEDLGVVQIWPGQQLLLGIEAARHTPQNDPSRKALLNTERYSFAPTFSRAQSQPWLASSDSVQRTGIYIVNSNLKWQVLGFTETYSYTSSDAMSHFLSVFNFTVALFTVLFGEGFYIYHRGESIQECSKHRKFFVPWFDEKRESEDARDLEA